MTELIKTTPAVIGNEEVNARRVVTVHTKDATTAENKHIRLARVGA